MRWRRRHGGLRPQAAHGRAQPGCTRRWPCACCSPSSSVAWDRPCRSPLQGVPYRDRPCRSPLHADSAPPPPASCPTSRRWRSEGPGGVCVRSECACRLRCYRGSQDEASTRHRRHRRIEHRRAASWRSEQLPLWAPLWAGAARRIRPVTAALGVSGARHLRVTFWPRAGWAAARRRRRRLWPVRGARSRRSCRQ